MRDENFILNSGNTLVLATLGDPQLEMDTLELGFRVACWLYEENEIGATWAFELREVEL